MIPTKTLRERMTEGLRPFFVREISHDVEQLESEQRLKKAVERAIQAIGDPCLIKTADSLEPTFTLRAQDMLADHHVDNWANELGHLVAAGPHALAAAQKIDDASACADAMRAWPNRKMPD